MARFLKKGSGTTVLFCYLPTWRWWVEHSEDSAPLKGRYDFDQAYNGGNSLAFEGDLKANSSQNVMLYSTKIPVTETTKIERQS